MYTLDARRKQLEQVAHLGRVFIPVHHLRPSGRCSCGKAECTSPGKHPIPLGWQKGDEQRIADDARLWLEQGRNVGIVTGEATGLLIVDLDDAEAVDWFDELNGDAPFFRVLTGRGAHLYYRHPGGGIRNSVKVLHPKVDVRGERGFVVAPGSIHSNGRMYSVDVMSEDGPQPVPEWLLERIKTARGSQGEMARVVADGEGLITEGGRNAALFSLAGSMRSAGLGQAAILAALRATNETSCVPPLPDEDLVGMSERASEYEAGTPAKKIKIGIATGLEVNDAEGEGKIHPIDVADAFVVAQAEAPVRLVRGIWLAYDGRAYQQTTEEAVGLEVLRRMQGSPALASKCKRGFVSDVVANIAARVQVPQNVEIGEWIESGPLAIVAENGIVDVEAYLDDRDGWLKPHDPDLLSTICLPFAVDQDAECPTWDRVLARIVPDEDTRAQLQRWFGLNLVPDISHQKAAVLVGEGSNGKSTVLEILAMLVGKGNYSTVPLEQFGERFELSAMVGKAANIAHEMGELDKAAEGVLKQLVSGEEMRFERKYKDPYMARPTARLTFSTNVLPRFTDRTNAIWRRLLIFPFDVRIEEHEKEADIMTKLRNELPGIFNWAISGLADVRQSREWESKLMANKKTQYREAINPFLQWAEERIQILKGDSFQRLRVAELHEDYRTWCGAAGYHPLAVRTFEGELERHLKVKVTRPGGDGARPRVVEGIRIVK